ncbi:MAG TPA: DNA translocase FtsK 4TM domain-containing protein, partial [Chloroflexota bacterium]|nr:DNA translocase FtsK 4TM domain-containing protein [Chloroflexota bacterium]
MARPKSAPTRAPRKSAPPPPPPPTWDERLIKSLVPYRVELAGGAAFMAAALLFLALLSLPDEGCPGVTICVFRELFGWGIYPLLLTVMAAGVHVMLRTVGRPYHIRASQVIGFELILLTLLPLSFIFTQSTLPAAYRGQGGGLLGWALSAPLLDFFGPVLTGVFYLCLLIGGVCLVAQVSWNDVLLALNNLSNRLWRLSQELSPPAPPRTVTSRPQATATSASSPVDVPPPQINLRPVVVEEASSQMETAAPFHRSKRLPPITLLEESHSL